MKMIKTIAIAATATALLVAGPALAQTSTQTKVSHDTTMQDGVATTTTKAVHTTKMKTSRPKKVLGVKVGHKTVTHKTVKKSSVSSNGDMSTSTTTK